MKLQIISVLTFLFFMMLLSFVKLQITPTQYGLQISFGQELQPVTPPSATSAIIADGECYSIVSDLYEQSSISITASSEQNSELQREQFEKIINRLSTLTDEAHQLGVGEMDRILP